MRRPLLATLALTSAFLLASPAAKAEPEPSAAKTTAKTESEPKPQRRSTGMMIGGGVMIGLGVVSTGASIPFFVEAGGCRGDFCGFYTAFGAGFLGLGVVLLSIGVPVALVGAATVTPDSTAAITRPSLRIGPGTATLQWQF
jgi:hypothetical protein